MRTLTPPIAEPPAAARSEAARKTVTPRRAGAAGNQAVLRGLKRDEAPVLRREPAPQAPKPPETPKPKLNLHIMIGDATRLDETFKWHIDDLPKALKDQLVKQVKDAFTFLPKDAALAVEWGQFKPAELKAGGNVQVWLIPEGSAVLISKIEAQYGYAEDVSKAGIADFEGTKEHSFDEDGPKRVTLGLTPPKTADQKRDPMTARPVMIKVPMAFTTERENIPAFHKAHPEATLSLRLAQLGYTILHEVGHDLGLDHVEGNIGDLTKKGGLDQSYPPDMMDPDAPVSAGDPSDAANLELTASELAHFGGADKLRKDPIVKKVEVQEGGKAKLWLDLTRIGFSKAEQDVIIGNLTTAALFSASMKDQPTPKK